jgi:hypothetical protein
MAAENQPQTENSPLLSPAERKALTHVANQDPPFSQRAQALLAIDQGATQPAAAQLAGLTLGQVRYWLDKFRTSRLAIFPHDLRETAAPETVETPPEPLAPESVPEIPGRAAIAGAEVKAEEIGIEETAVLPQETPTPPAEPAGEKKQSKKKSGKNKKSKKAKKGKKGKKGKKSKKKSKEGKPKKKKKGKGSKGKSGKKKKKKKK